MNKLRRVETLLDLADMDVEAAIVLAAKGNRYAAFHCQPAAEKLIKALLDQRDLTFGGEHHLDVLVDKLPDTDPWKATLRPFEPYSAYATTFRYAKPGGGLMPAPEPSVVDLDVKKISGLIAKARAELASPRK